MERSSMNELVLKIRTMIGDEKGLDETFSDLEIQDQLDQNRVDHRYIPLKEVETIGVGGTVSYLDFWSEFQNWETDATITNANYEIITPSTSEWFIGHWVFSTEPTQPVLITGKSYDLFTTAAEILENWAMKLKLEFDFSTQGQSFQRSQKIDNILKLAAKYREKQPVNSAKLIRED